MRARLQRAFADGTIGWYIAAFALVWVLPLGLLLGALVVAQP